MLLVFESLLLGFGLALLLAGGNVTVRGAAGLARQLGVPTRIVGLTVVALGTSAPEFAVNVTAALRGDCAVAFGNIMGSNLANVGLVLAAAALVRTLTIQSEVITREIPMMLLASVAALVMGFDALRTQAESQYDRTEGAVLLLFFACFLYYTLAGTLRKRASDPFVRQLRRQRIGARLTSLGATSLVVGLGLLGLLLGGRVTVAGAVGLATALGAPQELVGLSVVAIGTSLPELAASTVAARKGQIDLAVGNVVGSNLFNLLGVLGVTAMVSPVPVPPSGHLDLLAMFASAAVILILSRTGGRIVRAEGAALGAAYLAYLAWRIL